VPGRSPPTRAPLRSPLPVRRGNCLDIWAPGSDILSASNSSDTGTRVLSGTSMAGPHVAGAAALYLAAAPASSPAKVASALSDAALRIGFDSRSPSPLLNVQRLVPAPAPATPAPTTPAPTDPATPAPTDRATPAPTDRATPAPTSGPTPPAPGPTPPPSYGPRPIIIPGEPNPETAAAGRECAAAGEPTAPLPPFEPPQGGRELRHAAPPRDTGRRSALCPSGASGPARGSLGTRVPSGGSTPLP